MTINIGKLFGVCGVMYTADADDPDSWAML